PYLNSQGDLPIYFLSPALEQLVEQHVEHGELNSHLHLDVEGITRILEAATRSLDANDRDCVLLVSAGSRAFVSQILETSFPHLAVLSHNEVPAGIRLVSRGTVQ